MQEFLECIFHSACDASAASGAYTVPVFEGGITVRYEERTVGPT